MTLDECEKVMGLVCKLFPQTTREQAKAAGKAFRGFSRCTVAAALDEHVKASPFFTLADVLKNCEAMERKPDANGRAAMPDQSYADVVRSQDEQLRSVKSDVEVILRAYRKQWHACGQRAEYRASIKRQCTTSLMTGALIDGIPFTTESADGWAETIFADVPTMKAVLDDLRTRHTSGPAPKQDDESPWRKSIEGVRDHFEPAWREVLGGCGDDHGIAVARAMLYRHGVAALLSLSFNGERMTPAEADRRARAFVGLEPRQRIPWPEPKFATTVPVDPPQTSFDALKQLAHHEHGQAQAEPPHAAPEVSAAGSLSA